jgi:hypothetical protein
MTLHEPLGSSSRETTAINGHTLVGAQVASTALISLVSDALHGAVHDCTACTVELRQALLPAAACVHASVPYLPDYHA